MEGTRFPYMGMVQTVQMAVQMKLKTSRVTSSMLCGLLDKPWSYLNDDRFFFRKRKDKVVVALWCWPSVACWVKFSWEENVSYMYLWETNLFSMNFLGSLKYFFYITEILYSFFVVSSCTIGYALSINCIFWMSVWS